MTKFKRGDVVRVADDLGPQMSHFRSGEDAVVMGSYRDQFGHGRGPDNYTVMFLDGAEHSWYPACTLAILRHEDEVFIEGIKAAAKELEAVQSQLPWIVENWPGIREKGVPGASMATLMKGVGITDPWGPQGEGFCYHQNAQLTMALLDDVLKTGSVVTVKLAMACIRERLCPSA